MRKYILESMTREGFSVVDHGAGAVLALTDFRLHQPQRGECGVEAVRQPKRLRGLCHGLF